MPQAVIFDMDGVLVNSEPLWRKAMIKGFRDLGIDFTEADCRKTTGKRFNEVANYWINYHNLQTTSATELELVIVDDLIKLITEEDCIMEGVNEVLSWCSDNGIKTGLATSSSHRIIEAVLKKLKLQDYFHGISSAQDLVHGKPHPDVFLHCAAKLDVLPNQCVVIEDSINGVIAALAAQMQVIAMPDEEHRHLAQFCIAHHHCHNMHVVKQTLSQIFNRPTF